METVENFKTHKKISNAIYILSFFKTQTIKISVPKLPQKEIENLIKSVTIKEID